MALKGHRHPLSKDISFFLNEVAEPGVILVGSTGGSGAALDQSVALLTVAANPSGTVPIGILETNMVNIDQTRQFINVHRDEAQKGGKVTVGKKGWWVTNKIVGTPTAFSIAYLDQSGNVGTAATVRGYLAPKVGRYLSIKDEDGYAKVEIDLPDHASTP